MAYIKFPFLAGIIKDESASKCLISMLNAAAILNNGGVILYV